MKNRGYEYDFENYPLLTIVEYTNDRIDRLADGMQEFVECVVPRISDFCEAVRDSRVESECKRLNHLKFRIKK